MAFCYKCGSELVEGMAFCVKCGASVPTQDAPNGATQPCRTVPLQQDHPYQRYNSDQPYQAYVQKEYYARQTPFAKKGLSAGAKAGIIAGTAVMVCALAFGGFKLFQSLDKQTVVPANVLESAAAGNTASNQGQAGGSGSGNGSFLTPNGSGQNFAIESETAAEPEATETTAPETASAPHPGSSGINPGGITRDTLPSETAAEPTTAAPDTNVPATTAPTATAAAAPEATAAPEPDGVSGTDKLEERYLNLIGTRTVRMYIKDLQIVYTSEDLDVRGTVTYGPSDASCVEVENVLLLEVKNGANGLAAYIEYSSQISGAARGYIPMDIITCSNGDFSGCYSSSGFTVVWAKGDSFNGDHNVGKGEMVYLLSDEGNGTCCIMYPMDAGGWQIGYCRESDYNKYVAP